jgi:hypothetical protein
LTWRRPTLPRLETQYHGRFGVSRPSSEWGRVGHPRYRPPGRRTTLWPQRGQAARWSCRRWGRGGWLGKSCWHGRPGLGMWWSLTGEEVIRAIRTGQLFACRHASTSGLSTWWSTTALMARPGFAVGFPLRCVQRLSCPNLATRLRGWRHDRSTRGSSTPVLSY